MAAVQVHGAGRFAITGIRVHIRGGGWIGVQPGPVAGVSMVLVVVVTEMLGPGLGLVPAIRRHGRPAELERQEGEQDDGEDSTHGQESSGYRVGLGATMATGLWGFTTSRHECVQRCGSSGGGSRVRTANA